ncbi:addiction module protein [Microbacterium sp.]|uniref:addiction module protein n=1 Tax=Microbacterium sp. TaxID=51671 RepID=UPI003C78BB69
MALRADDVYEAGLKLASDERAAVAYRLLDSLPDDESVDFGAPWREIFRRRIDEVETGQVPLVSGRESQARVQALLAELRA